MDAEKLRVENLCIGYKNTNVLEDISLSIRSGEIVGIIGPNGAGKTTLLKAITAILRPRNGVVYLNGKDILEMDRKEIARIIGVVPQNTPISSTFTVQDMVLMGRYPHIKNKFILLESEEDIKIAEDAMDIVGIKHLGEKTLDTISGGEKQMAVIARALAQQPKILILDEPTSNLDIHHQIRILKIVKSIVKEKNISSIIVIHDLNIAARFCDKIILLHDHKILAIGTPSEVLTKENIKKAYNVEVEINYLKAINSLHIVVLDEVNGKE